MNNKGTIIPIDANGGFRDFEFTDSQQGYYTVSVKDTVVPEFRMSKDPSGQYKILADGRLPEWIYAIEIQLHDNIELSKHFFDNTLVSVITHGHTISGLLNGSTKMWEFKSNDPYFLSLYPNGEMRNSMLYIAPIPVENTDLFNKINSAIDKVLIERGADTSMRP